MVKWKALRPYPSSTPFRFRSNVMILNEQEFIVIIGPDDRREDNQGPQYIYKYHVQPWHAHGNPWTILLESPVSALVKVRSYGTMAIDQSANHLFLAGSKETVIMDLSSGSVVHKTTRAVSSHVEKYLLYQQPVVLNANGVIHKLEWKQEKNENGDWSQVVPVHEIWNHALMEWRIQHVFESISSASREIDLIHVPSKNIILMIGGGINLNRSTGLNSHSLREIRIRRYHISTGQWEVLKAIKWDLPYSRSNGCVLSADERYVILMPIVEKKVKKRSIYALDIRDDNDYKLWKSVKRTPKNTCRYPHRMTKSGGKGRTALLASGWIRRWRRHFPRELVVIIGDLSLDEMIHWITTKEHRVMPLSEILHEMHTEF